ncbi:MAG: sensor histidine kinase, partial [Clostridia bacterium]|nr:sensor histidine kinase [Clostridia bacterium]
STLIAMQGELSRLKTEKSYYDILEHQDEQLLAYAHDTKNHLSAIKNLNDNPLIDAYLDEMAENLKIYRNVCRSGNITLDVIINKYITECKIKGITFTHDVRVSNLKCIDDFDLVTILGNLLDNAIEAAEKSAQKSISIETDCRNNYSIIIVSNSCDFAPKSRGDKLLTTKTDSSVHGIGVKNVAKAVKKYDGDLSWEYDISNSTFKVTIMMKY